jgi:hypothetical protein
MHQRNDSVFQLSLTEIAFTLVFILLILLGWMYSDAENKRQDALAKLKDAEVLPHAQQALESIRSTIHSELAATGADPNEVIQRLLENSKTAAHVAALQSRVEELDAALTALAEVKAVLQQTGDAVPGGAPEAALLSALELRARLEQKLLEPNASSASAKREKPEAPSPPERKLSDQEIATKAMAALELHQKLERELTEQLAKSIESGQEGALAKSLVDALKDNHAKENADLRGQLANLKRRLEARGGRDYPPCWAEEATGKVQFLFSVEVRPDAVAVAPAWPPSREADAKALPFVEDILTKRPHSYEEFRERVRGIFQQSDARQCRHYVQLRSTIPDAVQSDRARLMVESFFYKVERAR